MTGRRSPRPSITDVASRAGVSYQTVSRVINTSGLVAPATRARVLAAIDELGFRPSSTARALRSGRGSVIGVLTARTVLHGYASTLAGIEEAAQEAGLSVTATVLPQVSGAALGQAVDRLLTLPLVGTIALTHDSTGEAALDAVPATVAAVAAGGLPHTCRPRVIVDERAGAAAATAHLLALGHRTVHHVGISGLGTGTRHDGRADALRAARRTVPPSVPVTWEPRSAWEAAGGLAGDPSVTAVLCDNDELAIALIAGLTEAGVRVPTDISVVGFDDHPLAAFAVPALTTVRQDFIALGRAAVEQLTRVAGGTDVADDVVLPTMLMHRASTARASTAD